MSDDQKSDAEAAVNGAADEANGPEAQEAAKRELLKDIIRKIKRLEKRAVNPKLTDEKRNKAVADKAKLMAEHKLTDDDLKPPKRKKPPRTAKVEQFYSYLPEHDYIFIPTRAHWPASSIIAILGAEGMERLDRERAISAKAWAPGLSVVVRDKLAIPGGGWIDQPGSNTFNTFLPPPAMADADGSLASEWLGHVMYVFPDDWEHIVRWLAYRVQHPEIKINHCLVMGSEDEGIGKDTILEPVKRILGTWNVREVSASAAMDPQFNPHMESLLCCINEANDLGDNDRFDFHNARKTMLATPPNIIEVADKHVKRHPVVNVTGVVIFTNNKTTGIYISPKDRRHHVSWSERVKADFPEDYWVNLYAWFDAGGTEIVNAYLRSLDLSDFDPKAPPPLTTAWHEIVAAGVSTEDNELKELIEFIQGPIEDHPPTVLTLDMLKEHALSERARNSGDRFAELADWIGDRRNAKAVNAKLLSAGYTMLRNDGETEGRWFIGGRSVKVYSRKDLPLGVRLDAARDLIKAERQKADAARKAKPVSDIERRMNGRAG